jgi:hypothetical protein
MKIILSFSVGATFLLSFAINVVAQDLTKQTLSQKEIEQKMTAWYAYEGGSHYTRIDLKLFKNGTFKYSLNKVSQFSEGTWKKKNGFLILNSSLSDNNVPIKLTYSNDTADMIRNFKVGAVRNLNGQVMKDGLININDDNTKCDPGLGICTGEYASIDSIKIYFENGMKSKWIRVEKKEFKKLIPVAEVPYVLSNYVTFTNFRYKILGNKLKQID